MVLNVNGASGTVQVLLDGVQVNALTTTMNFGNTPIGRLMIGDNTAGKTFQVAFDEVVAFVTSGDTQDPTAPSGLQATAVTNDHVDLSWGASTDNVGVTSYEIRRNGGAVGTVPGNQTTFTDSTVAAGTAYTYQVFANDAASNQSPTEAIRLNVTTTSTRVLRRVRVGEHVELDVRGRRGRRPIGGRVRRVQRRDGDVQRHPGVRIPERCRATSRRSDTRRRSRW